MIQINFNFPLLKVLITMFFIDFKWIKILFVLLINLLCFRIFLRLLIAQINLLIIWIITYNQSEWLKMTLAPWRDYKKITELSQSSGSFSKSSSAWCMLYMLIQPPTNITDLMVSAALVVVSDSMLLPLVSPSPLSSV